MKPQDLIKLALEEDLDSGDITTDSITASRPNLKAVIMAKENAVICGLGIAMDTFKHVDRNLKVRSRFLDGDKVKKGDIVLEISGNAKSILKAERVALNFLQRLSGIATITNVFVSKVRNVKIYDTRKTTPLLRELEKYAVKKGGGYNHRFGLFDQVLIKENHIFLKGDLKEAIREIRQKNRDKEIEVEVRNLIEFKKALEEKAEIILLDNMIPALIKACLKEIKSYEPIIEVSGGIDLRNITLFDIKGVNRISIGSLTHSVKAIDFSLILRK